MKNPMKRYHPTELQAFTLCPMRYKFAYIDKLPAGSPSKALLTGVIGHKVLEQGANNIKNLSSVARDTFKYYKNMQDSQFNKYSLTLDDEKAIVDVLNAMLERYRSYEKSIGLNIKHREMNLKYDLGAYGEMIYCEGTVDLIATLPDSPPGFLEIVDYKFGAKPSGQSLHRNLQLGHYYIASEYAGLKINRVFIMAMKDFIPYKRKPKNKSIDDLRGPVLYPAKIRLSNIPAILNDTISVVRLIENGFYYRASYGKAAPCEYCAYTNVCPSYEGDDKDEL